MEISEEPHSKVNSTVWYKITLETPHSQRVLKGEENGVWEIIFKKYIFGENCEPGPLREKGREHCLLGRIQENMAVIQLLDYLEDWICLSFRVDRGGLVSESCQRNLRSKSLDEATCGIRLKAVALELLHFQIWLKQSCLSISCELDAGYTGEKQHRIVLYPVHEGFLDREGVWEGKR